MNLAEYERSGRTFVIAEIAQAHDGSVGILHSLVDAVAATGVDAIKFQVHIAEAESSTLERFRMPFSDVDASRFDYWKRMELSVEQWTALKARCERLGVEFIATPFSSEAADLLDGLGVQKYKVGSGDTSNPLLLERLARMGKDVLLSTGLVTLEELDAAVASCRRHGAPVTVLQCTTKYPTTAPDVGLGWLFRLRERYHCPVGLSDHSGSVFPGLGAVALGAVVVETHVTFDKRMFGPDAKASLTVDECARLVEGIRFLEQARGSGPDKALDSASLELRRLFGKALVVNRRVSAGEALRLEDLDGRKPADAGVPVSAVDTVVGRRLSKDKQRGDFIQDSDLL